MTPEPQYQHVRFKPWRGDSYGRSSQFELPVLVLGESHHDWPGGRLDENATCEIIGDVVGGWRFAFWTKIASAFLGSDPTLEERSRFWNSVAYYNFVQESAGLGPRDRLTLEMWQSGVPAFFEVLTNLQPRCIVVLGKALWQNLPPFHKLGPTLSLEGQSPRTTGLYQVGEGFAVAAGIDHPSSFGWHYHEWHPWISQALLVARQVGSN